MMASKAEGRGPNRAFQRQATPRSPA
jgi:hypothetical protein